MLRTEQAPSYDSAPTAPPRRYQIGEYLYGSRNLITLFTRGELLEPQSDFLFENVSGPVRTNRGRRSVIKGLGIGAAKVALGISLVGSGGLNIDTYVGDEHWGGTDPRIETIYSPEAAKNNPFTHTLVIGGYNVDHTDKVADAISDTMFKYSQVDYLEYSNNGIQVDDLKREMDRYIEEKKVRELFIYGQSMGGMVGIELGAHAVTRGVYVNTIVPDCSPMDLADIRPSLREAVEALVLFDELSITGGPGTRFIIEFLSRWATGRRDIGRMCLDSLAELDADSCSNKLIQSQASYMKAFDLSKFKDAFPSSTRFARLRPDHLFNDGTIDNAQSQQRLIDMFPNNEVIEEAVVGGGHASPIQCRTAYNNALQTIADRLHFFDGSLAYNRRVVNEIF